MIFTCGILMADCGAPRNWGRSKRRKAKNGPSADYGNIHVNFERFTSAGGYLGGQELPSVMIDLGFNI